MRDCGTAALSGGLSRHHRPAVCTLAGRGCRRHRLRSQLAKRVQDLITAEEGGSAASLDTTSSVTTLNSASWWRPYEVVLATSVATSLAFVLKRAAQSILVMLAIALIAFAVKGALGDPLREIMGEAVPEAERAELRHKRGLDAPWPTQLARYIGHAARGDLGQSYVYKRPTLEVVLAKFPASFELVLAASLIVLLVSLPAGIYCAVKPLSLGARLILWLSVLCISVPVFLTGVLLISVFSVWLGWRPAFGRGETVEIGFWET